MNNVVGSVSFRYEEWNCKLSVANLQVKQINRKKLLRLEQDNNLS